MGKAPESWLCVDCGVNTASGMKTAAELAKWFEEHPDDEGAPHSIGWSDEVYTVRRAIWAKAGMKPFGGCLCIGCLEKRLGRELKPKDFKRGDAFNFTPGTPRLILRRKQTEVWDFS
jgi:hypothetical protein